MMAVKGWGERELPEGHEWVRADEYNIALRDPSSHTISYEREAELVLRVFAPDQIEDEPEQCGDIYLSWECGLVEEHPQYPHMDRTIFGGSGVAWVKGNTSLGDRLLTLPANMMDVAPWFGADE